MGDRGHNVSIAIASFGGSLTTDPRLAPLSLGLGNITNAVLHAVEMFKEVAQ